jgi:basic membrane protein A
MYNREVRMKRAMSLVLVALLAICTTGFAGCAKTGNTTPTGSKLRVVLYVNATLGDKSFFDSANAGIQQAISELGITGKTVEGGTDTSKWEPDIMQLASSGDWDIIIVDIADLADVIAKLAPQYPNMKFIGFDGTADYTKGNLTNVYSIEYKQNEASFLAGVLAALVTESSMPLANKVKVVGFLGGMDIPVINDFKVGFLQGVKAVDPAVKVLVSYVGSWSDAARCKELALAQIAQGADVVWGVAGQSGLGAIDAAKEKQCYALGVDSDQAEIIKATDPREANLVLTSVLKNVGTSLYRAIKMAQDGTDASFYGKAESLGLAEGTVGLADNDIYQKVVPAVIRAKVEDYSKKIASGAIKVDTALGS